jgi:hypothetical protein
MKLSATSLVVPLLIVAASLSAQDKTAVQTEKPGPFSPGAPIVFNLKLNEPLPKDARFDLRISPVAADEEVPLGAGEPVDATRKLFRVTGKVPDGAIPGEWHVSVIYLFLPGSGWTHSTIAPNDLRFEVGGKPYSIPTKAEVKVER